VTQVIREEIKFLEFKENENVTYQNLWDTARTVLRGKFIAISAYFKKTETSQISNLMTYLKLLEKQEHTKPKTSRQREITNTSPKSMKSKPNKLYKESMKQKSVL
jgi:hypothetical protein